ncbi:MAG TPA: hypothetical protein VMD97_03750 [Candidatus Aquilonibacter sp.]|nr:hypothetical protein [Candidatus Aquilonibacter sp.]
MKCIAAFACSVGFALPCLAQANPWNGSWKIDPSTVKFDGPTFSIAMDNEGYVVTRDGKAGPKTVCDGKPHKSPTDGAMVTCNKMGQGYAVDVRRNGKLSDKIRVSLSADGKTMVRKDDVFPDDGTSPFTVTNEARRISGGSGLNGEWKGSSFRESQDKGILSIRVSGGMIAFKETDNDKPVMCKLDGTATKFMGGTMAVKPEGTHTLKVIYTGEDGKVRRDNTFVLSADGKTLTETDVTPSPSASTMSMKFHKM